MKKNKLNIVLALMLVVAGISGTKLTANAETEGLSWSVTYNGSGFTSTYDASNATISDAMPGDTIEYTVEYINGSSEAAVFYMNADVVKTLEEGAEASGGAYSYKITTNTSDTPIFDSETVGGDATAVVGLDQVNGKEGAYFSLGEVAVGKSGKVTVSISLDGNSQTNSYMDTLAEIELKFGAESATSYENSKKIVKTVTKTNTVTKYASYSEKKSIVKKVVKTLDNGTEVVVIDDDDVPLAGDSPLTGDSILPIVFCGILFVVGLMFVIAYFRLVNKKEEVA